MYPLPKVIIFLFLFLALGGGGGWLADTVYLFIATGRGKTKINADPKIFVVILFTAEKPPNDPLVQGRQTRRKPVTRTRRDNVGCLHTTTSPTFFTVIFRSGR